MPARKLVVPILLIFLFVNLFSIVLAARLKAWGFDQSVLIVGNLVLFILTMVSFFILKRGLQATSTHGFIRAVYGSFIIKMIVAAATVFIYLQLNKENVNKPSLFACVFLYFVYTFIEIGNLMKLTRRKKNV